jgi:hypothetical protein
MLFPDQHIRTQAFPGILALLFALILAGGCSKQTRPAAEQEAEARRLYMRADDFVKKIGEGSYSYDYINFHYNQADKNVERILTAYPETEMGRKLKAGELKLGSYTLEQFRDIILPQLGDMKEATESFTNCAIYLHNLPEAARAETRAALALILEYLCRSARSDEAVIFPTLPEDQLLKDETIIRIVSTGSTKGLGLSLVKGAEEKDQAQLAGAYARGQAVGGLKLEDLTALTRLYPAPGREVELGILQGMIERMRIIYGNARDEEMRKKAEDARAEQLRVLYGYNARKEDAAGQQTTVPKAEPVRYDVAAYYRETFGSQPLPAATIAFAGYRALNGEVSEARAMVTSLGDEALETVIVNYYDHLGLNDRLNGSESLHRDWGLGADAAARCDLKLVEFLVRNGLRPAADKARAAGIAAHPALRDQYIRSYMRGVFYSRVELFHLTKTTLTDLDIRDPAVCAEILLDWALSPNRLQKGDSWGADQILFKYFSMQKEGRQASRQFGAKRK